MSMRACTRLTYANCEPLFINHRSASKCLLRAKDTKKQIGHRQAHSFFHFIHLIISSSCFCCPLANYYCHIYMCKTTIFDIHETATFISSSLIYFHARQGPKNNVHHKFITHISHIAMMLTAMKMMMTAMCCCYFSTGTTNAKVWLNTK